MTRYKLFILILPLLFSCKKENSPRWTEVRISQTNYFTGDTIPFTQCEVTMTRENPFPKFEQLDWKTNVQGQYYFGFKARLDKDYYYAAHCYYDINSYYGINYASTIELEKKEEITINYQLVPYAQLQINATNLSCFDSNDEIKIYKTNLDVAEINSSVPITRTDCFDGTVWDSNTVIGTYALEWHVTKNASTSVNYDTLVLNENDDITYQINY